MLHLYAVSWNSCPFVFVLSKLSTASQPYIEPLLPQYIYLMIYLSHLSPMPSNYFLVYTSRGLQHNREELQFFSSSNVLKLKEIMVAQDTHEGTSSD